MCNNFDKFSFTGFSPDEFKNGCCNRCSCCPCEEDCHHNHKEDCNCPCRHSCHHHPCNSCGGCHDNDFGLIGRHDFNNTNHNHQDHHCQNNHRKNFIKFREFEQFFETDFHNNSNNSDHDSNCCNRCYNNW